MLAFARLIDRREAFLVHQLSPNVNPLSYVRDCCLRSPYTTFHRFQSIAYQPNTHVYHVALTGMKQCCSALPSHSPNVSFMLISSSTDMTNFDGKRDRERLQVRCSDLVGSDLPQGGGGGGKCGTASCGTKRSSDNGVSERRVKSHEDLGGGATDISCVLAFSFPGQIRGGAADTPCGLALSLFRTSFPL